VVAASAVVGMLGREGLVIRRTFWPFVYYALFTGALGYRLVWAKEFGAFNAGAIVASIIALSAVAVIVVANRR